MIFPLEIEMYIISFIPFSNLKLVSKNWNKRISFIIKKSLLIIEKYLLENKK